MPSPDVNLITQKIIGCAYDVSNALGAGFVEKVYENALVHRIRKSTGLSVAQQHPIKVVYDEIIVGEFFADLLVDGRVLVELKAVSMLTNDHTAQALNYLRATGFEICLLINFGKNQVEIKFRLYPYTDWKEKKL
ncbi:MAG: GxxExxY protein [Anaerolineales bacterium]|uniref:GxxExxY protein n=1 Tax=Candidatus Villigracilis proximus TaxID=3140683 RepID=UPI0031347316|nr:GxxExxY protein [Anaerolineales bacterium]